MRRCRGSAAARQTPGAPAGDAAEEPSAAEADHPDGADRSASPATAGKTRRPVRARCGSVGWGATPVPVGGELGDRPVAVPRQVEPHARGAGPDGIRFPVADLLRRRPRDRDRDVTQILAGRWPGPRRVVFGSLTGGPGRSTAAALLTAAAADAGVPVLLLDATGDAGTDLAARVGGSGTRRDWTRLTGAEAEVDFAALRRRGGTAASGTSAPVCVVTITGDAGSAPPADAVAAGAAAAARSWPLVLVDLPHGAASIRATDRGGRGGSAGAGVPARSGRDHRQQRVSPGPGRRRSSWTARAGRWSRSARTAAACPPRRGGHWPGCATPRPDRSPSPMSAR